MEAFKKEPEIKKTELFLDFEDYEKIEVDFLNGKDFIFVLIN